MRLFSDRGTPDGYHDMHGYSGHTYKWTKSDGTFVYVKTTLLRDTGFKVGSRGDPLLVFGRCLMRFLVFPA